MEGWGILWRVGVNVLARVVSLIREDMVVLGGDGEKLDAGFQALFRLS